VLPLVRSITGSESESAGDRLAETIIELPNSLPASLSMNDGATGSVLPDGCRSLNSAPSLLRCRLVSTPASAHARNDFLNQVTTNSAQIPNLQAKRPN